MRRCGFTLIELLVVVSLIILLAALILSVFFRVREKGRQVACASNLRQLWMAFHLYAQDHDELLPPYRTVAFNNVFPPEPWIKGCAESSDGSHVGTIYAPALLVMVIKPYTKNDSIWFCPSDPYAQMGVYYWCVPHKFTSYFINIRSPMRLSISGYRLGLAEFMEPSQFPLASDPNLRNPETAAPPPMNEDERQIWSPSGGHHFGGWNTLYLDGHVKWQRLRWIVDQ